jgi:hypothetical protein
MATSVAHLTNFFMKLLRRKVDISQLCTLHNTAQTLLSVTPVSSENWRNIWYITSCQMIMWFATVLGHWWKCMDCRGTMFRNSCVKLQHKCKEFLFQWGTFWHYIGRNEEASCSGTPLYHFFVFGSTISKKILSQKSHNAYVNGHSMHCSRPQPWNLLIAQS